MVGGGPTGVETAGELAITARAMRREFRRIDPSGVRVILLDAGDRLVTAFSEALAQGRRGARQARRRRTRGRASHCHRFAGVTIEVGGASERIDTRTVIWAAGVHAVPLTAAVAHATGASTDRGGRIEVNPDLTVPGHPEISVIGDVAALKGPGGRPLPGLATVAIQQARHVAKAIERVSQALHTVPLFRQGRAGRRRPGQGRLRDPRARAVRPARLLHLPGRSPLLPRRRPGRRLEVLVRWIGARFGERQSALIEGELESVERGCARGSHRVGAEPLPAAADLDAARSQMAFTLGFHIILACLGVAFPAIIPVANYLGLRRSDADALAAQRWSKVAAVTFVVGAITGTVLSFEMGLLWPEFMGRFGDVFGPPSRWRDLLLHGGDLHRDLHLRLEALGWAHFWTGVPS